MQGKPLARRFPCCISGGHFGQAIECVWVRALLMPAPSVSRQDDAEVLVHAPFVHVHTM